MGQGREETGGQVPMCASNVDAWRPDLACLPDRSRHALASLSRLPAETDGSGRQKPEETISGTAARSCLCARQQVALEAELFTQCLLPSIRTQAGTVETGSGIWSGGHSGSTGSFCGLLVWAKGAKHFPG